jgi:NAD(P)-dependent dehydrogenase (short-subunit alcohol dehydrogenase family)
VPAFSFQADLTDPRGVKALFSNLESLLNSSDTQIHELAILVNSAAVMTRGDIKSLPVEAWDWTLSLNLRAPWLCAQEASRRMPRGGLIVNITDVAAIKAWSAFPAYTVSKAALESLTRLMARSFAPDIRVNAIAPGLVIPADDFPADAWEELVARTPFKRSASPQEVASALEVFVQNKYITGETITIDGGYSLV